MELIQFVLSGEPKRMKDVEKYFNLKLSTLTSIIDKAEKTKLIKRVNSKGDRRVVFLEAVPKGIRILDNYDQSMKDLATQMESQMSPDVYKAFLKALDSFIETTETHS